MSNASSSIITLSDLVKLGDLKAATNSQPRAGQTIPPRAWTMAGNVD